MAIDLEVIAPELPPGSCVDPSIIVLMGKIRVLFDDNYSLFIESPNEPTVEQRNYVWVKTNSLTNVIDGLFTWSGLYGKWLKNHFPGGVPTDERRIFVGDLSDLETYDGGEPGSITETTGPFWIDAGSDPAAPPGSSLYIKPSGRVYDRSS